MTGRGLAHFEVSHVRVDCVSIVSRSNVAGRTEHVQAIRLHFSRDSTVNSGEGVTAVLGMNGILKRLVQD